MKWQQIVLDSYRRQAEELEKILEGLTQDDLNRQPAPHRNSIGWLAWHVVRVFDRNMSEVMGEEQEWIKGKWYTSFGRLPDPDDTGMGQTTEQVSAFRSPGVSILAEYQNSVTSRVANYISSRLTEAELNRKALWATHKKETLVGEIIIGQM